MSRHIVGIDLGGTFTKIGLVSAEGLEVVREERLASEVAQGPAQLTRRLAEAVRRLGERPAAIGVGVAGLIDTPRGAVLFSPNFPGWTDVALGPELSRATGLPVAVENDANMAALGEQQAGAARGLAFVACLTLGTGVGGGLILGGRLYRGASGQAGEIGHMSVGGSALCGCGRKGCLETLASATGLARMAREGIARGRETSLDPEDLSAAAINRAASEGDRFARSLYRKMGKALGFALGQLFNLLDLEAAVLAGGVAAAWDAFMPALEIELHRTLLPRKEARVLKAALGERAGIIGAACVARRLAQASGPQASCPIEAPGR